MQDVQGHGEEGTMSKEGIDVDTIDQVSLVFRANGKSYAVAMGKVNKYMLFSLLPTMMEGPMAAVELAGDFSWEPVSKHKADDDYRGEFAR